MPEGHVPLEEEEFSWRRQRLALPFRPDKIACPPDWARRKQLEPLRIVPKTRAKQALRTKVMQNYQSAWSWDIYSLHSADEMVRSAAIVGTWIMDQDDYLEDMHLRILRVTEDLRAIQRELNCAAMEAPANPELMEALNSVPEIDSLEVLKTALDQMRHFLWFYAQVMENDSEEGEKLRQSIRKKVTEDATFGQEAAFLERFKYAGDTIVLRHLADSKNRKPN